MSRLERNGSTVVRQGPQTALEPRMACANRRAAIRLHLLEPVRERRADRQGFLSLLQADLACIVSRSSLPGRRPSRQFNPAAL